MSPMFSLHLHLDSEMPEDKLHTMLIDGAHYLLILSTTESIARDDA